MQYFFSSSLPCAHIWKHIKLKHAVVRETNLDHIVIETWLRLAPLMLLFDMLPTDIMNGH